MDLRSVGPRYGDLLIAAALAVLLSVEVLLWPRADHALPLAAALLATLPLALRRRLPVVALLLIAIGIEALTQLMPGFDNDSFTLMVVFVLTLYSVGRHARRVEAWLAGLVVAGCVVGFLLTDSPPPYDVGDVAFALAFVGGPWAAGLAIRLRRDREQTLTAHNVQLQREQEEKARQAVGAERARIARELHDVVSHAISVTVLQARGGRRMLGVDDGAVRRALDAIEHTNAQALSRYAQAAVVAAGRRGRLVHRPAAVAHPARLPGRATPRLGVECRTGDHGASSDRTAWCGPVGLPDHPRGADQRAQARGSAGQRPSGRGQRHGVAHHHSQRRRSGRDQRRREDNRSRTAWHSGTGGGRGGTSGGWARRGRRLRRSCPTAVRGRGVSSDMIRVVLADDQPLVRAGLRMILAGEERIEVVGEAADGAEAVTICADRSPDVILMDVRMPNVDGIEATRRLSALPRPPRILVLTTFDLDDVVYDALRAGASGFLLKDAPEERLITAIRVVADGGSLFAPSVTRRLIEDFARRAPAQPTPSLADLTERETEVLVQVARGLSNAEIASALFVTENTVKTHVARVLMKLGLRDRVQAVVLAYESGLVRPAASG